MEMMIAALMGNLAAFSIGWYVRGRWRHNKSEAQRLLKFRYPSPVNYKIS